MNRRKFLQSAVTATVGLPLVVSNVGGVSPTTRFNHSVFRGLPQNRNFEMPEAPNLSRHFRQNAGGVLRIESDELVSEMRKKTSLSRSVTSYKIIMGGKVVGLYTLYVGDNGYRRDYCGKLPERGKFNLNYINTRPEDERLMANDMWGEANPLRVQF